MAEEQEFPLLVTMEPDAEDPNMSKTPVPFAPETLETIQRAFRMAADRRHDDVGLEHLLLAITDEPQARRILTGVRRRPRGAASPVDRRPEPRRSRRCRRRRRWSRSRRSDSTA